MKQLGLGSSDHKVFKKNISRKQFQTEKNFSETASGIVKKGDVCKASKIDWISKGKGHITEEQRGWDLLLHNFI